MRTRNPFDPDFRTGLDFINAPVGIGHGAGNQTFYNQLNHVVGEPFVWDLPMVWTSFFAAGTQPPLVRAVRPLSWVLRYGHLGIGSLWRFHTARYHQRVVLLGV